MRREGGGYDAVLEQMRGSVGSNLLQLCNLCHRLWIDPPSSVGSKLFALLSVFIWREAVTKTTIDPVVLPSSVGAFPLQEPYPLAQTTDP
jgi:hypothetical protein